jgi:hypothetical protein
MAKHRDEPLPEVVRRIKDETNLLIRIFDQFFLRTCGVVWEDDIYPTSAAAREVKPKPRR